MCAFADVLVVFEKTDIELQESLDVWRDGLSVKKLKINEEKTFV